MKKIIIGLFLTFIAGILIFIQIRTTEQLFCRTKAYSLPFEAHCFKSDSTLKQCVHSYCDKLLEKKRELK